MATSMSCSTPESMKPPQRLCVADNFNHPVLGHEMFRLIFRQFQADQNAVDLQELNAEASKRNVSSSGFTSDPVCNDFLKPINTIKRFNNGTK